MDKYKEKRRPYLEGGAGGHHGAGARCWRVAIGEKKAGSTDAEGGGKRSARLRFENVLLARSSFGPTGPELGHSPMILADPGGQLRSFSIPRGVQRPGELKGVGGRGRSTGNNVYRRISGDTSCVADWFS